MALVRPEWPWRSLETPMRWNLNWCQWNTFRLIIWTRFCHFQVPIQGPWGPFTAQFGPNMALFWTNMALKVPGNSHEVNEEFDLGLLLDILYPHGSRKKMSVWANGRKIADCDQQKKWPPAENWIVPRVTSGYGAVMIPLIRIRLSPSNSGYMGVA